MNRSGMTRVDAQRPKPLGLLLFCVLHDLRKRFAGRFSAHGRRRAYTVTGMHQLYEFFNALSLKAQFGQQKSRAELRRLSGKCIILRRAIAFVCVGRRKNERNCMLSACNPAKKAGKKCCIPVKTHYEMSKGANCKNPANDFCKFTKRSCKNKLFI